MLRLALLLFFLLPTAGAGEVSTVWRRQGQPVALTEARQERAGFGAALLITADPGWEDRWGAPSGDLPPLVETVRLRRGEQAWLLILLTNPQPDAAGNVEVTCDLKITRPNGRITHYHDLNGLRGQLKGPATYVYPSDTILALSGEENDPLGVWMVELLVRDRNRKVSVPVRTQYTLVADAVRPSKP